MCRKINKKIKSFLNPFIKQHVKYPINSVVKIISVAFGPYQMYSVLTSVQSRACKSEQDPILFLTT